MPWERPLTQRSRPPSPQKVTYAVPGTSYPSNCTAVHFDMVVPALTHSGSRTLQISVEGTDETYTLFAAFLLVA